MLTVLVAPDTVLDDLEAAVDRLFAAGPEAGGDPETLAGLLGQQARLGAFVARAVAAFDAGGSWSLSGARSATAWLQAEARLSGRAARAQVRRGRALARLPEAARAWERGELTGEHVDVLAPLLTGPTGRYVERDEHHLVGEGCRRTHEEFVRIVEYWKQLADPDGTDRAAEARRTRRDAYLVRSVHGRWLGRLTLDPVSGAGVGNELHRLEQLLFEAEWAEARERLGREPTVADLPRTPGQRRADAFVEMARRSRTVPGDGRRPAPLFTVLVGYETLHGRICQLEDGTVVPPGELLDWLPGADLERAEYRSDGRIGIGATARCRTVDASRFAEAVFAPVPRVECPPTHRCFTGATRRAIEVRDRECCHPSCHVPAAWCQVDHIRPFAEGGPTTQENGRLLCGTHNRMRNHGSQRPPPRE